MWGQEQKEFAGDRALLLIPENPANERKPREVGKSGGRVRRRVVRESADHRGLSVAQEDLCGGFTGADHRSRKLDFVGGRIVGLLDGQVHVAVRIDCRRNRERGPHVDVLHRLHAPRWVARDTLRYLHERTLRPDIQDRFLVVLRNNDGQREHLHIAAARERVHRHVVVDRALAAGQLQHKVPGTRGARNQRHRVGDGRTHLVRLDPRQPDVQVLRPLHLRNGDFNQHLQGAQVDRPKQRLQEHPVVARRAHEQRVGDLFGHNANISGRARQRGTAEELVLEGLQRLLRSTTGSTTGSTAGSATTNTAAPTATAATSATTAASTLHASGGAAKCSESAACGPTPADSEDRAQARVRRAATTGGRRPSAGEQARQHRRQLHGARVLEAIGVQLELRLLLLLLKRLHGCLRHRRGWPFNPNQRRRLRDLEIVGGRHTTHDVEQRLLRRRLSHPKCDLSARQVAQRHIQSASLSQRRQHHAEFLVLEIEYIGPVRCFASGHRVLFRRRTRRRHRDRRAWIGWRGLSWELFLRFLCAEWERHHRRQQEQAGES